MKLHDIQTGRRYVQVASIPLLLVIGACGGQSESSAVDEQIGDLQRERAELAQQVPPENEETAQTQAQERGRAVAQEILEIDRELASLYAERDQQIANAERIQADITRLEREAAAPNQSRLEAVQQELLAAYDKGCLELKMENQCAKARAFREELAREQNVLCRNTVNVPATYLIEDVDGMAPADIADYVLAEIGGSNADARTLRQLRRTIEAFESERQDAGDAAEIIFDTGGDALSQQMGRRDFVRAFAEEADRREQSGVSEYGAVLQAAQAMQNLIEPMPAGLQPNPESPFTMWGWDGYIRQKAVADEFEDLIAMPGGDLLLNNFLVDRQGILEDLCQAL